MKTEFTKGEWHYEFSPISQVSPNGHFIIKAGDAGRPICIVPLPVGGINGKEKQEANAKLMTSAVDLLDALNCLMKGVESLPSLSAIAGVLEEQYKQAEAAIKKATE